MIVTYLLTFLACVVLSLGVGILFQSPLNGENIGKALTYLWQSLCLGTVIYAALIAFFGGILMFITNYLLIDKPFKSLDKDEEVVTVIVQKNVLMVEVDGTVLVSRLLEGEYIDYKNIIKNDFLTAVKVNKAQLLAAIERVSVLATDIKKIVKFDIKENYMTVSASSEVGKLNENVLINLEGKDLSIAFNSKYVTDCIKVIDDEFVNLYFNTKINPCVIKPYSGDDYLYLILPLRINA